MVTSGHIKVSLTPHYTPTAGAARLPLPKNVPRTLRGGGFPGGSAVKNLPAMQETQEMELRSLGQEDPLEKEMATHSSVLAWRIPGMGEPGGPQSMGSQRVKQD